MKIAFLCSSLEPGQDGVGDYTRRLASELIRQGHPCLVVALNDALVTQAMFETQESEGTSVSVLRLPRSDSWDQRLVEARNCLDRFRPDWVSFQFVTFSYHRKGLCHGLGKKLTAINSQVPWHVMLHELWLGLGERTPFKHRVLGALQRIFIRDMIRRLRPLVVHTQADPYRQVLSREKIPASVLPLISNVPFVKGDGWSDLLEPMLAGVIGQTPDRSKFYLAGIFGAVHPEWNAQEAVNLILPLVQRFQKRLVLVFAGRNNLAAESLTELKSSLRDRADIVIVGEKSALDISRIFQTLDIGLATSPRQMIQKSGSVAALLEHGLPVLVTRDDWRVSGADLQPDVSSSRLLSPKQFGLLNALPIRDAEAASDSRLEQVAKQFLASLKSASFSKSSST